MEIETLYELFLQNPSVSTDSRQISGKAMFFALRGERFDGNQFAPQALENGAAFAIVDRAEVCSGDQYILVDDALACLQKLANYHRRQFDVPFIAITGSNGKTTTKELVSAVLGMRYRVHSTRGNYNNHIGLPLTLLAMPAEAEVAVIEMGANHRGEIEALCQIAEPTHGLITNVGKAHLEGFGSFEGVKKTKAELYHYLATSNGLAFVNKSERFLEKLAEPVRKKIFYAESDRLDLEHPPYEVKLTGSTPFLRVAFLSSSGQMVEVNSRLLGSYNFNNLMTAIVLGKYFKVPALKIKEVLESFAPQNNRSQVLTMGTNTFILDAYNANPDSMEAALLTFSALPAKHKMAVLGDMLELGTYSREEHEAIARLALGQDFDRLVLVGPLFGPIARDLGILHFETVDHLKDWYLLQNLTEYHLLIKGSRKIELEKLLLP